VDNPTDELVRLQGVWFPTHITVDGQLTWEAEPRFPTGREPWLLTVLGGTAHVTAEAEYYATGGRLRADPAAGRLVLEYPELPAEWATRSAYRLAGDVLETATGGFPWSGPHDMVSTTRYVRVAAGPTPAMAALIEQVMRSWVWQRAAEPGAAADGGG
jgi:hypothetical protein